MSPFIRSNSSTAHGDGMAVTGPGRIEDRVGLDGMAGGISAPHPQGDGVGNLVRAAEYQNGTPSSLLAGGGGGGIGVCRPNLRPNSPRPQ
jgi:hypothetical protein